MYAIIEESGKQFKVTSGTASASTGMRDEAVKTITFDKVFLVAGGRLAEDRNASRKWCDRLGRGCLARVHGPKIDIQK